MQTQRLLRMPLTLCIIVLCTCVTFLIQTHPDDIVTYSIFFGASYRPFVLAGEWWRLVTGGFVHYSYIHLFVNMFSLYVLGSFLEPVLSTKKYGLLLVASVIGGSLASVCIAKSTLVVGLSGGLYGLTACQIWLFYRSGYLRNPLTKAAILRVLAMNLLINFLPHISYTSHIGGFVVGMILSLLSVETDKKSMSVAVIAAMIVTLFVGVTTYRNRYITNPHDIYLQTDYDVLALYEEKGFQTHAKKMMQNLLHIYEIQQNTEK